MGRSLPSDAVDRLREAAKEEYNEFFGKLLRDIGFLEDERPRLEFVRWRRGWNIHIKYPRYGFREGWVGWSREKIVWRIEGDNVARGLSQVYPGLWKSVWARLHPLRPEPPLPWDEVKSLWALGGTAAVVEAVRALGSIGERTRRMDVVRFSFHTNDPAVLYDFTTNLASWFKDVGVVEERRTGRSTLRVFYDPKDYYAVQERVDTLRYADDELQDFLKRVTWVPRPKMASPLQGPKP